MSAIAIPGGLLWPWGRFGVFGSGGGILIDATTEKCAYIGRLYIDGRVASKTLDTSGSSAIGFQVSGTPVFANNASTIDIGIQGVNTSGPVAQPDSVFSAKTTVTTAKNTTPALASANAWCVASLTNGNGSGTWTASHGDLFSVVFDFTNKAGVDAVTLQLIANPNGTGSYFPITNAFVGAPAWGGAGTGNMPNVVITFSDGTIGTIDATPIFGFPAALIWTDSTNPDEQGLIFQVPFNCKIDAICTPMRSVDGTSDFILSLFSSPETAANSIASITVDAAQTGTAGTENTGIWNLASEISISANTDYCVSVKASGAGNIRFSKVTLGDAAHRKFFPAGQTIRSVTRNAGTGNFSGSSTNIMLPLAVRISQISGFGGPQYKPVMRMG